MNHQPPLLHVVLYQPEIPQNAGNIGRTCVALGAKLWLVRPLGFRLDQRHLRRAGLDYWQHLDLEVVDDWTMLLQRLPAAVQPWYLSKAGSTLYTDVCYQVGEVLVFGSESQGLPAGLLEKNRDRSLRIPMPGPVRSLNLACTVTAVALEVLRQCGGPG